MDDVYIPVNCDGNFHWVLAVVELNQRLIHVMLPCYLLDNGFFEKTKRTNWLELDAYKDKQTGTLLEPHHPFNVEHAQGIMQQECDSLDCGLYVDTFAEFLSDQLTIPSDTDGYLSSYLHDRYAALLWRYGSDKVKGQFTTPTEEDFINID
ncbi:hypothetical protein H5410_022726 [Solanum commersonii]|uniref:Ubiquitin-like protease family profile domain-containing protein n=1 Tax=Solanum commersonii TaxID=4109 RepID=A0A9J5ZG92_SOLCO|nr:hypothetical protein H5410_022726 [Solanum commersonii]